MNIHIRKTEVQFFAVNRRWRALNSRKRNSPRAKRHNWMIRGPLIRRGMGWKGCKEGQRRGTCGGEVDPVGEGRSGGQRPQQGRRGPDVTQLAVGSGLRGRGGGPGRWPRSLSTILAVWVDWPYHFIPIYTRPRQPAKREILISSRTSRTQHFWRWNKKEKLGEILYNSKMSHWNCNK